MHYHETSQYMEEELALYNVIVSQFRSYGMILGLEPIYRQHRKQNC